MNMTKPGRLLPACLMCIVLMLAACHGGLSRDQIKARSAAERCYKYLRTGRYDRFVGEIAYADQMSPEYRQQMQDLVHESAQRYESEHGKMLSAVAADSSTISITVFSRSSP